MSLRSAPGPGGRRCTVRWMTRRSSESFETISERAPLKATRPRKKKPATQLALIAGLFEKRALLAGGKQLRNKREGRRIRKGRRRSFRWRSRRNVLWNVFAVRDILRVGHVL